LTVTHSPIATQLWRSSLVRTGIVLLLVGEALIIARLRPYSDFYFPFVWLGLILLLDGATQLQTGRSLLLHARASFLAMFPVSVAFWWLFELLNQAVHNWMYVGAERYSGIAYVAFASLDFSTVLPAVWVSALAVRTLLPHVSARKLATRVVPRWVLVGMVIVGILSVLLAVTYPTYAFGAVWLCMFFLLDPINHVLGRPSMIGAIWRREWRLPISFALGTLFCGFFWEGWNFWSMPKWTYAIPYVDHWKIFEMPLLGWSGYLPFGLELFAMTNFVFPLLRLPVPSLDAVATAHRSERDRMVS